MRWSFLFPILIALCSVAGASARAAAITGTCDERVAGERSLCIDWMQRNLVALGCKPKAIHCNLHPWASDFVHSWVCTAQSENCEIATGPACPSGTTRLFRDGWEVCRKGRFSSFEGMCHWQNGAHPFIAPSCAEAQRGCLKFGGVPSRSCQKMGSDWQADCRFRDMDIRDHAESCEKLRNRCVRVNSPLGPKGLLTRCLARP